MVGKPTTQSIARNLAKTQGLRQFEGNPCKRCGEVLRYVSGNACVACDRVRVRKDLKTNAEYRASTQAAAKRWVEENPELNRQQQKEWYYRNRERMNAYYAAHSAGRRQATPLWADLKAIEEFYRRCPVGYEVDHIAPLRGKNVCGLHVENNLQYLTIEDNRKKKNRWSWEEQK